MQSWLKTRARDAHVHERQRARYLSRLRRKRSRRMMGRVSSTPAIAVHARYVAPNAAITRTPSTSGRFVGATTRVAHATPAANTAEPQRTHNLDHAMPALPTRRCKIGRAHV